MNLNNIEIFCIYPKDKTTHFLNKVVKYLEENLGEESFFCFRVKCTRASHDRCLEIIDGLQGKFIIFLGHGRSDKLFGASGEQGDNTFVSEEAREENERFFSLEDFIIASNAYIFRDNIVFSFSCNSNEKRNSIATNAIENGAIAFVGFGDMETDYIERFNAHDAKPKLSAIRSTLARKINSDCSLKEYNKEFTKKELAVFKGIIVKIIKKSILYAYKKKFNIDQLVGIIKILTSQEIYTLLKMKKGYKYKLRIAKNLYHFKDDIAVFGDLYASLFVNE